MVIMSVFKMAGNLRITLNKTDLYNTKQNER
jgi:hypothetical protein